MIQTILLATDGSPCAERAIQYAASLAKSYRTKVIVLHAYIRAAEEAQSTHAPNSVYETRRQAYQLAEVTAGRLRSLGVSDIEIETVEGPAANAIIGVADSIKPDILIIGARGLSLWPGSQLGSVSMAVTQRVECPVLVIK